MAWTFRKWLELPENANCLFLYSWLFAWNTFYYLWPCLVGWMGVLLLCLKYYLPNSVRSLIETPGSSWWNNIVCFIILLVFMWYVVFKPEMLYNQYKGLFQQVEEFKNCQQSVYRKRIRLRNEMIYHFDRSDLVPQIYDVIAICKIYI